MWPSLLILKTSPEAPSTKNTARGPTSRWISPWTTCSFITIIDMSSSFPISRRYAGRDTSLNSPVTRWQSSNHTFASIGSKTVSSRLLSQFRCWRVRHRLTSVSKVANHRGGIIGRPCSESINRISVAALLVAEDLFQGKDRRIGCIRLPHEFRQGRDAQMIADAIGGQYQPIAFLQVHLRRLIGEPFVTAEQSGHSAGGGGACGGRGQGHEVVAP